MRIQKSGVGEKDVPFKTGLLFATMCILILGLWMPRAHGQQIPAIIIDQDMSSDHDDVGDLAVLEALADLGECQILACMSDSQNGGTPLCQSAINTYYGRPNIPCGRRPDSGGLGGYPAIIASEYPHPLYATWGDCPLAVNLYRQILASQPDHSVSIVTTGYMNNLEALLQSGSDQYSPLTGSALVAQKVKLLSCAGGQYPSGGEFNFTVEPAAAYYVINNWPAPATFTGFEIGGAIDTAGQLQLTGTNNPIRTVWALTFFGPYPSWGQIGVYNAVRASESQLLWGFNSVGRNNCNPDGTNFWTATPNPGNQAYLLETERFPIQEAINSLIMDSGAPKSLGTVSPPNQPSDLRAAVTGSTINLQWTDNSWNETGFKIERRINGVYSQIGTVEANVTTYSDTGLSSTANVGYRVKATNAIGDSNYTNIWVYSGWTETDFSNPANLPLYTYCQTCDLRATASAGDNHVTLNNDSTHGQDLTIHMDVGNAGGNYFIYFFYQNQSNWYRLNASSSSSQFEKCVSGTISQIGAAGTGVAVGGNLQDWLIAVTNTGTLQFIYNGGVLDSMAVPTMVLNVSDTLSFSTGKIGLGGSGGATPMWQNFSFNTISNPAYALTVNSGSGSGNYATGQTVTITANAAPNGQQFTGWTGAHGILANASSAVTTLTMPAEATTITPNYAVVSNAPPLIANGTYEVTAQSSGLALSINGSAVVQQTYSGAATQQWTVTNLYNNVAELTCSANGEVLDVPLASMGTGTWLDVTTYSGEPNQQWTFISMGNGYYQIINVNSNLAANVGYNSLAPGIGIDQWGQGGADNNLWAFTSTSGSSAPGAPGGLTATPGSAQVSLNWTASGGATSYNVFRGISSGGESSTAIATGITTSSCTDTGLSNGTTYYYTVAAVNSSGTSSYSNEASATPAAAVTGSGGGGSPSIGVQFESGGTALATTGSAGLSSVAQANWNALAGSSFSNQALTDSTGAGTTAQLNGSANGSYRGGGSSALPAGNADLASGELFNTWPSAPTLTVSNVPYAQYDIYVYAGIDAAGRNETVSITPSGGSAQYFSFTTEGGGSAWTVATSTWNGTGTAPTLPGANYAHFSGLTAGGFTMAWGAPGNGGLNGIQIVSTGVSTLATPTGLTAASGTGVGQIALSWTASTGAQSYILQRSTSSGGGYTPIATVSVSATAYTDSDASLLAGQNYYYEIAAANTSGTSVFSASAVATPYVPATFIGWAYSYFGLDASAGQAGDTADPAKDGLPNLLKYALGLNPLIPETFQPTVTRSVATWQFAFQRPANRSDITYAVEVSPDLSSGSWTTNNVTLTETGAGDPETWQATYTPASGSKLFFRLQITGP